MSDRTRRRFLADLLFAGGALTAASVVGYVVTHQGPEQAGAQPTPTPETPVCTPNPDMRPAGEMQPARPAASQAPAPRPEEMRPAGLVAPNPVCPAPSPSDRVKL